MGGSSILNDDDELEFNYCHGFRTLVLVGRTGNGKSATGNSILRRKAFKSKASFSGVTRTCELQTTVVDDLYTLNVIDAPGLFDFSPEHDITEEIAKCIDLAKDGVHAVIFVLSVRNRFSKEEEAAIQSLQNIFGSKIIDHMIVLFTGGDELEENGETLGDRLGHADCPASLKETIQMCGNRLVLFDNKTNDPVKKSYQLKQLLSLVNDVVDKNGGQPYTNEIFVQLKNGRSEQFEEKLNKSSNEVLIQKITEIMNELELSVTARKKETTDRLEQKIAEEQAARLKTESDAEDAKNKSNAEIRKLREDLERAHKKERRKMSCVRKVAVVLFCRIVCYT